MSEKKKNSVEHLEYERENVFHLDIVCPFGLSIHHQETKVQVLLCPPSEEEEEIRVKKKRLQLR